MSKFKITGEVIPKLPELTPLDEVIRALVEGDGATLAERREEIADWLQELRRYREAISCVRCKKTVLGRHPVCLDCYAASVQELIAESLVGIKGATKRERLTAQLRTVLERKIGR